MLHDSPSSGHLGVKCTIARLRFNFAKADIKQYHTGVTIERVAIDLLGPLPETKSGSKYIDYFTKWIEGISSLNIKAETVANALIKAFICVALHATTVKRTQGNK